jgi:hypothetical protein
MASMPAFHAPFQAEVGSDSRDWDVVTDFIQAAKQEPKELIGGLFGIECFHVILEGMEVRSQAAEADAIGCALEGMKVTAQGGFLFFLILALLPLHDRIFDGFIEPAGFFDEDFQHFRIDSRAGVAAGPGFRKGLSGGDGPYGFGPVEAAGCGRILLQAFDFPAHFVKAAQEKGKELLGGCLGTLGLHEILEGMKLAAHGGQFKYCWPRP